MCYLRVSAMNFLVPLFKIIHSLDKQSELPVNMIVQAMTLAQLYNILHINSITSSIVP